MSNYDATGGEQGWIMKSKLNELRLDAGIARIENQQWLCVLDKETGMMIDPMIGFEKFAELIVVECIHIANLGLAPAVADAIKEKFGVESE
jgi:hypothetical protein